MSTSTSTSTKDERNSGTQLVMSFGQVRHITTGFAMYTFPPPPPVWDAVDTTTKALAAELNYKATATHAAAMYATAESAYVPTKPFYTHTHDFFTIDPLSIPCYIPPPVS